MRKPRTHICLSLILMLAAAGCDEGGDTSGEQPPYTDHGEASDLVWSEDGKADGFGAGRDFDPNHILSDTLFLDPDQLITAEMIQTFFESENPYGLRSWLADEMLGDESAAEAIVGAAHDHDISPLMLLARMQVEASLVSRATRPSDWLVDRAFGCGCFDGQACFDHYLGLANQLDCAAETLRGRYDTSADGTGGWRKGRRKNTLDPIAVTPDNHATAALYAYTPWVLRGRGGNWLVWRITQRFGSHLGVFEGFIGDACESAMTCQFEHEGAAGVCLHELFWADGPSMCTGLCNGYCDDLTGRAPTFCAAIIGTVDDDEAVGICLPKSNAVNDSCEEYEDGVAVTVERFRGGNPDVPAATASVCLPERLRKAFEADQTDD